MPKNKCFQLLKYISGIRDLHLMHQIVWVAIMKKSENLKVT